MFVLYKTYRLRLLFLINDGNLTERDSQEFTALLQQSKNIESHLL